MPESWEYDGHRFSNAEVEERHATLRPLAQEYLRGYTGTSEFLLSVQMNERRLTFRQTRGTLNYMRNDARGRQILVRGPRPGPAVPPEQEKCPLLGTEHNAHWFPLKNENGSRRCLGWHALTRKSFETRARFPKPFLRGATSNLIHRSTHEGRIVWFPENWHAPGPSYISSWTVGRACTTGAAPLKNPITLTAEEVKTAESVEVPYANPHTRITLCSKCFPGTQNEVVQ